MSDLERKIDPGHSGTRDVLRVGGAILLVVGGIFTLIAFIDFFSSFNSFGSPGRSSFPSKFWMFFIGLPLAGLGMALLKFGFLGAALRYGASETAPVARDTFNHLSHESAAGIRSVAQSVSEGIAAGARGGGTTVECSQCATTNDEDAKFCRGCGAPLATVCPTCGTVAEPGGKFCDQCGTVLTP